MNLKDTNMCMFGKKNKEEKININILICDDVDTMLYLLFKLIEGIFKNPEYSIFNPVVKAYLSYEDMIKEGSQNQYYDLVISDWNLSSNSYNGSSVITKVHATKKCIFSGMTKDSIEIAMFCLSQQATFIPKMERERLDIFIKEFLNEKLIDLSRHKRP